MKVETTGYYIQPVQMKNFTREHKKENCSQPVYLKALRRIYMQETLPSVGYSGMGLEIAAGETGMNLDVTA